MDELIAFLNARLDERERRARAASWDDASTTWTVWRGTESYERRLIILDGNDDGVAVVDGRLDRLGGKMIIEAAASDEDAVAEHIADNDPEFVLADVAAKRRHIKHWQHTDQLVRARESRPGVIRNELLSVRTAYERVLRDDAAVYSEHPDYRRGDTRWLP